MADVFISNVPQSISLWGSGYPAPHNWDKMTDTAKQVYKSNYVSAAMLGCDQKSCHGHAMKALKQTHKIQKGMWVAR
jgi:hypothetical protein